MAPTFPAITASFPTTLLIEPRLQGFNPGQQVSDAMVLGLKRTPIRRDIEFRVSAADSLTISDFMSLRDRDNKSFNYAHPSDVTRRYVCPSWGMTNTSCNEYTFKAIFLEVYEVIE